MADDVVSGKGWAIASLNELGEGPGFRKIRGPLGVTAFGINGVVLPAGYVTPFHFHERQQETYFVHAGEVEFEFWEEGGPRQRLGPGGLVRVDPETPRRVHNVGDGEATMIVAGGADGYVGRDGLPGTQAA